MNKYANKNMNGDYEDIIVTNKKLYEHVNLLEVKHLLSKYNLLYTNLYSPRGVTGLLQVAVNS